MKWVLIATGSLVLLLGVVTFWLPIPSGLPLALFGLFLLVRSSPRVRRTLARLMRRHPPLRRLLQRRKGLRRASEKSTERR
jgi:uncharacterized membrane protein YbaN (DUF454 family)